MAREGTQLMNEQQLNRPLIRVLDDLLRKLCA
jgi:hypothetical protein